MTKISGANIENFQRVEVARIAPSNHLIVFAGKNAQGKSSALNAIEAALCGHSSRNNPRPIKDGAKNGEVVIELDNGLTATRRYTPSGTTLTVKAEDGGKYGQAKLSELVGTLGMDVSQFTSLGEREQRETLLGLVDLPFNPAELDAKIKATREERTIVNRRTKELDAQALEYAGYAPDLPEEEISVATLAEQHRAGHALRQDHERGAQNVQHWGEQVEQLRADLARAEAAHIAALEWKASLEATPDLEGLALQIDNAEDINRQIRRKQDGQRIKADAARSRTAGDMLTGNLAELEAQKVDGLAEAKMPVAGLTFDDEGLLYNGVPFSRASTAEQVTVSAAMMVSLKPGLRSLIVRNGNDLDAEHLEQLRDMAEAHDFQIFIERVADDGEYEYTFTDGALAEQ